MEAAHDGDVLEIKKVAKELDKHGHGIPATVANTTFHGVNALHAASGLGRLPVYQYLIEEVNMVEIDKPDAQGHTPVEHALTEGHLPAARYLLDRGADLHQRHKDGTMSTLLHSAAALGHSEIVKFLLSRGADIDALSFFGTPLSVAALRGHASTVKILLQHNADPNKGTRRYVSLGMAIGISSVSCVKLLIQGGANVSGGSPCDIPLVAAAEKGLTEVIKCLLEAGANPNVPDTDDNFVKKRVSDLKQQADEAFRKQDYLNASVFYTQALRMDNFDARLLSNRSLCWARMGHGEWAYDDADKCQELCPKWAKSHYWLGVALMCMKEYDGAHHSLSRALQLDPESQEIMKLLLEVIELK
uniref:Uncharacterized protein n=1 Tax=Triticum urartu TaxID=4572 RepID=A0A8R7QAA7_TRIUA